MFKVDILFGQIKTFIKVCVAFVCLKGHSRAQKQWPYDPLRMLWFDEHFSNDTFFRVLALGDDGYLLVIVQGDDVDNDNIV